MGKKYCIFSAQYLPSMGGVENYTYNIAKKLIAKGIDKNMLEEYIYNHKEEMNEYEKKSIQKIILKSQNML